MSCHNASQLQDHNRSTIPMYIFSFSMDMGQICLFLKLRKKYQPKFTRTCYWRLGQQYQHPKHFKLSRFLFNEHVNKSWADPLAAAWGPKGKTLCAKWAKTKPTSDMFIKSWLVDRDSYQGLSYNSYKQNWVVCHPQQIGPTARGPLLPLLQPGFQLALASTSTKGALRREHPKTKQEWWWMVMNGVSTHQPHREVGPRPRWHSMHGSPHPQSFKIDLSEAVGDRKLDQWLSGRKSAWIFLRCGPHQMQNASEEKSRKFWLKSCRFVSHIPRLSSGLGRPHSSSESLPMPADLGGELSFNSRSTEEIWDFDLQDEGTKSPNTAKTLGVRPSEKKCQVGNLCFRTLS